MNYEENISELESVISKLEKDEIGFEESLKLYEKACGIIKNSYEKIKEGKGKIVKITEELNEIDFDIDK